jgi:hypothetical protein
MIDKIIKRIKALEKYYSNILEEEELSESDDGPEVRMIARSKKYGILSCLEIIEDEINEAEDPIKAEIFEKALMSIRDFEIHPETKRDEIISAIKQTAIEAIRAGRGE